MSTAVDEVIENMIRAAANENNLALSQIQLTRHTVLVEDLGFTSWTLVGLLSDLEAVLGVDPLHEEDVMMADIRTVGDLCNVYESCLARAQ